MPHLTDAEKQDVIRYLEAGKPLPDKYRFLLFDDKREVELVWNGKSNEVTNVVLPFQVIEQVDEPRAESVKVHDLPLFWTDWIDYWSVDFDFESKREIIRVKDEATGEVEEKWTGDDCGRVAQKVGEPGA